MNLRSRLQILFVAQMAVLLAAAPLSAATYVFMSDGDLVKQASHVAEVVVSRVTSPTALGRPAIEYHATVQQVLKGEILASRIVVMLPGGVAGDGTELYVPGVPTFREGEELLLFLDEAPDGSFGVLHWALGAFRKHVVGGRQFALRDLRDEDFVARSTQSASNATSEVRDYAAFAGWVRDRALGIDREADYFLSDRGTVLSSYFNLFKIGGRNARWFEFDSGQEVIYKTGPGNSFNSTNLLQFALDAWNNEGRTPLRLRRSGSTGATGGLSRSDGVNTLVYGDPNGLIPGTFDCSAGGFLAAGFFWTMGTANSRGSTYHRIVEGDVVINDGVECLKGQAQTIAEMFTHEIGHTLGIAHSCGSPGVGACTNRSETDATMRATIHADGRSASIRADDEAALRALYEGSGGGGGEPVPPPTPNPSTVLMPPSGVSAVAISGKKVELTWIDNSTGETENEVWIKRGRKAWALGATLGADETSATVKQLDPGTQYKFRVRSKAGASVSKFSDSVKIKTPGGGGPPAAPSELAVVATSNSTATISWKDNSNNEKKFVLQIRLGSEPWHFFENTPANTTSTAFEGATPGATYRFRIRARRGDTFSAYSDEATITMPQ